ncbi:MAG: SpoIIE family protein phosphatase, partial [bacterium]|nr:SpoIIE family protein phosphatase [bacterium]
MKGILFSLLLLFIVFPWEGSVLTALDPHKSITQYKLDIWGVDRGFPQNAIFAAVQDRSGYIWLGTLDGLFRFDGVRFTVFNKENTPQLKSNEIRALYLDRDGSLWIGTSEGGLSRLKDRRFTTYTTADCPALKDIYSIIRDRRGALWIGSKGSGIVRFKDNRFTTYTTGNGLASNRVRSIHEDKKGNLWVGTAAGLTKLIPSPNHGGREDQGGYTGKTTLECGYIYNLYEKRNGELWIGSFTGLYRMKDGDITHYPTDALPNSKVVTLYEDRSLNFWLGTDGGGLARMEGEKFYPLTTGDGLACGFVYSICEDREGSLWIGTLKGGLHRLRDTTVTVYTTKEGLRHDTVKDIYEDSAGNLYAGTNGGISLVEDGKAAPLTAAGKLLSNIVMAVLEDGTGALWIGTTAGLHRLKNQKLTPFTTRDGLSDNRINSLYEDKQGTIWIGTLNGLNRYREGKFTVFNKKDGLANHIVACMLDDREGNLWIGTEDGLNRLKDGKFTTYTTREGLAGNNIECMYENKRGILYIGTRRGGISRFSRGKFINYTTRHGLIANRILCILEDDRENLWLAGPSGISRIGNNEWNDLTAGKIEKILPVTFNEEDGMKTRWCGNRGVRGRDGKLWFTTSQGLVMIDPANIKTNTLPPPVIIEELKIDGEQVDFNSAHDREDRPLLIPPGKGRLEFHYTGISFMKPRKMKFKLKLTGYDTDWIDNRDSRTTTYTRLPPGHYTLTVIARNSDGAWNQKGASFSFYMQPYFWQTTWFYILVSLFVVFAVFSGFRFRVRQLKAREKKLSLLVNQRTEALNQRTLQLEKAHSRLQVSKAIIEEKNQHIMDSISYARKIQHAALPPHERMKKVVKDYFNIFKPRDIVSGDVYWFDQGRDFYFIAVVDCTGHGVPGAFLSMMANMELNEIVHGKPVSDPAALLLHLHHAIRRALQQEDGERMSDDGMDVGVCMIDFKKEKITFAGAGRPLYYVQNNRFFEIKGDKKAIGGRQKEEHRTFTSHEISFQSPITFYLTSDGFADQNNHQNKKYGSRRLKQFIQANAHLPLNLQEEALLNELENHRGNEEQRDDITI